jgi:predicted nucleic acid-binding Zn ribbon protein
MAKKSNLIKVGDAIQQLFRQENLDTKISQFTVKQSWKEIAGEPIAVNTTEISFKNKTIFVSLKSDAMKHELSFRKEELLKNINKFCGCTLVEQIVIR